MYKRKYVSKWGGGVAPCKYDTSYPPYTGEQYREGQMGNAPKPYSEVPIRIMLNSSLCICYDGTTLPDYACTRCEGTGRYKTYSLYELALMTGRKGYEGFDSSSNVDNYISNTYSINDYIS